MWNNRFELLPEPTGTWMIFDRLAGAPADHEGVFLVGLRKEDAERLIECGVRPRPAPRHHEQQVANDMHEKLLASIDRAMTSMAGGASVSVDDLVAAVRWMIPGAEWDDELLRMLIEQRAILRGVSIRQEDEAGPSAHPGS